MTASASLTPSRALGQCARWRRGGTQFEIMQTGSQQSGCKVRDHFRIYLGTHFPIFLFRFGVLASGHVPVPGELYEQAFESARGPIIFSASGEIACWSGQGHWWHWRVWNYKLGTPSTHPLKYLRLTPALLL